MSDFPELLKPSREVTDTGLQIEVGNLKAENERLQNEYGKILESSRFLIASREKDIAELRSELQTVRTRWDELCEEFDDREEICAQLRSELADLKQNSAPIALRELPDAADLLNKLKGKRKKSRADLGDIEAIFELLDK